MAWWKIKKDNEIKKSKKTKSTKTKTKKVVNDDLKETREIILELKRIQKRVSTLKRGGRDNPNMETLLDRISDESYNICLKC